MGLKQKRRTTPRAARAAGGAQGVVRSRRASKRSRRMAGSRKAMSEVLEDIPFVGTAKRALGAYRGTSGAPRKSRRMNPMNARAARRAASRVKSSIKMLERLKKSLPHVTSKGRVTVRKRR